MTLAIRAQKATTSVTPLTCSEGLSAGVSLSGENSRFIHSMLRLAIFMARAFLSGKKRRHPRWSDWPHRYRFRLADSR